MEMEKCLDTKYVWAYLEWKVVEKDTLQYGWILYLLLRSPWNKILSLGPPPKYTFAAK